MSGPSTSTRPPPTTISDATLSHPPRTSRPLRRSAPKRRHALELERRDDQRPATGEPDRDRQEEERRREQRDDEHGDQRAPRTAAARCRTPGGRRRAARRPPLVDLDERPRRRRLTSPSASSVSDGSDREHDEREQARRSRRPIWTPSTLVACRTSAWSSEMSNAIGTKSTPMPTNSAEPRRVHPARTRRGSGPTTRRRARRSGAAGRHVVREQEEEQRAGRAPPSDEGELDRVGDEPDERPRAVRDGAAEEVRSRRCRTRCRRERCSCARASPPTSDRVRPLRLQVRPGRAVEERGLQLAPAPLERDPREVRARRGRIARDRPHDRAARRSCGPRVSSQPTPSFAELPR